MNTPSSWHSVSKDRFFSNSLICLAFLSFFLPSPGNCSAAEETATAPRPIDHPELMLGGPGLSQNAEGIDFANLPRLSGDHTVVSDVRSTKGVNQHIYLVRFLNQLWLMWSDGPGIEDRVGQRVKFAVSDDGLSWSKPAFVTPEPPISGPSSPHYNTRSAQGFRWIARGFWPRRGELLALASLDEAADYFGPSLQLKAFRLDPKTDEWQEAGTIFPDAINFYPPQQLPSGLWMMSRQPHDLHSAGVQFLVGGVEAIDKWDSLPFPSSDELAPGQPFWWVLPDGGLAALQREKSTAGHLFRSFSQDGGRNWSQPVRTNFPAASPGFHGLRLNDGRYAMVSYPGKSSPLVLSISPDGLVFDRFLGLVDGLGVDCPFLMEHQGNLLIAFSREKQSVEVHRFPLTGLEPATNTPQKSK